MRKGIGLNAVILFIATVFASGSAFAVNGAPSGPHWNINIIGHPKGSIGGDDSSGHSIMIPLRTVPGPDILNCNVDGVKFVDDTYPSPGTLAPTGGARIYFEGGETFEIKDRDATDDNGARIVLPVDMNSTTKDLKFAVYMRVLGKPNKYNPVTGEGTVACMNINAYVNDAADQTLWYQTGTVTVSRAKGKSSFVRVTDLFMVWFCTQMEGTTCTNTSNLSVFNDIFSGYFWQILNDGTRLVQVRFYPTN